MTQVNKYSVIGWRYLGCYWVANPETIGPNVGDFRKIGAIFHKRMG